MIKRLFFLLSIGSAATVSAGLLDYMNNQNITFKTIFTGDRCTSIDYNIVNNGDGNIGGDIRLYGIHNMTIDVAGYETVHLIKNDVCLYPYLFTILNTFLPDTNMFVQRWACVKWFLPLSFGFKVENDLLTVYSSIWKFKILSWCRTKEVIVLVKKSQNDIEKNNFDHNLKITVSINGRSATVEQKTIVQIYSLSSLHPWAVLARMLFL